MHIRQVSRRPLGSKRKSSTRSACSENSAKFTPSPSQVAPSGCGSPRQTAVFEPFTKTPGGMNPSERGRDTNDRTEEDGRGREPIAIHVTGRVHCRQHWCSAKGEE